MNYIIGAFKPPCDIFVTFSDERTRKQVPIKKDNGKTAMVPAFQSLETIAGEVSIAPVRGKRLEHTGVKIELLGRIELYFNRGNFYDFTSLGACGMAGPRTSVRASTRSSSCAQRWWSSAARTPPRSRVAARYASRSFGSARLCESRPLLAAVAALDVSKDGSSAALANTQPSKGAIETLRNANAVCFDVDSTVILDEGIDELADFCGAGKAVAEWTAKAMTGTVPFEEALAARLSLIKPSLSQVEECLKKRPPRISPGMADLIKKLKLNNINVFLVSGGFRQMIKPVAFELGIPPENIIANQLLFGTSGEYAGFDPTEPTSRSGGKAKAVQQIKKDHGYRTVVMIGDGATDLEARQPGGADLFICYAGVQMREPVAAEADWVIFDFQELITNLP